MTDPIKRIKAPVRFEFTIGAGQTLSRFLAGLVEGRILGRRCPGCAKVYVPPRGACPTCALPAGDEVAVSDAGTVTTFCIVNVPFEGQTMKLPYVYASVLLDGADIPLLHLVNAPAEEARMGMRVRAEWAPPAERRPTLESIRWFSPTGEPDAPFDAFKEHL
ncbi:MAG TPA: Zn-ribbon domain-containing OB-fold protein [Polyangiaceae bacterium]